METIETLRALLLDTVLPNHLPDVAWLLKYIHSGCPNGSPLILSLGESWSQTPKLLTQYLADAPEYVHGYQLSMYGLPFLRSSLHKYINRSQLLSHQPLESCDAQVAISWSGTRSAMFDFARFMKSCSDDQKTPVVLAFAPSWDYAGVFEPLGFKIQYASLRSIEGFIPNLDGWYKLAEQIMATDNLILSFIIINAQHNPTGINWTRESVRSLIQWALEHKVCILLDDAHYAVHDTNCTPTSSLSILMDELANTKLPAKTNLWFAVRSLGKQFNCNGWALGAMIGPSHLIDELVNKWRIQYQYNTGALYQYAMAQWLNNLQSNKYLENQSRTLQTNRLVARDFLLSKFGYNNELVSTGECTNFILFSIPAIYTSLPNGVGRFLADCFAKTAVLLTSAFPRPRTSGDFPRYDFVRMYIGGCTEHIRDAFERMLNAGIHYDMSKPLI